MRPIVAASLFGALAPFLQAQNCFDRELGTDLGLADDATAQGLALGFPFPFGGVAYTQISVCSNGYVWLGPTAVAGGDSSPTLTELRDGAPRLCPLWADLDPSAPGGGHVYFHAYPDRAVVSWAGVALYGTSDTVEFQLELMAGGHVNVSYGAFVTLGRRPPASTFLIGASRGDGATIATVSFDALPLLTTGDDFAQVRTTPLDGPRINWSPTWPGYALSANPCSQNGLPPPARFELVGTGCTRRTVSVYEEFTGLAGRPVDLAATTLRFQPNGIGGYLLDRGAPRARSTGMAAMLPAGDNTTHRVLLPFAWPHHGGLVTEVVVSSNGFVALGSANPGSGCCSGSVVELLAGPPRIAALWQDLDPSAGGGLFTVLDPVAGEFAILWDKVPERGYVAANTFRVVFEPAGGFRLEYDAVAPPQGLAKAVVGYSEGNAAFDPGATDLSAFVGVRDLGAATEPLRMFAAPGSLPRVGATFVTCVTGVGGHAVFLLLGLETPPFSLAMFGAPGCTGYVAMPPPLWYVNAGFGLPTSDFAIPIPMSMWLAGQQVMAQACSDDVTATPLGWSASNGGRWTIGM